MLGWMSSAKEGNLSEHSSCSGTEMRGIKTGDREEEYQLWMLRIKQIKRENHPQDRVKLCFIVVGI